MGLRVKQALLAAALANGLMAQAYANTESGVLNQELNQRPVEKVQPSGELFDNSVKQATPTQSNALQFSLTNILVQTPDGAAVAEDLSSLTQAYLNKPITLSDLNILAQKITAFYRSKDYLVAKAILPPQEIEQNSVRFIVVKGKIGQVSLNNQSRFNATLAQKMVQTHLPVQTFLYKSSLERLALLLNDVQGVKPNLSIKAGKAAGTSDVVISLNPDKTLSGYVLLDNQGNKDTGKYRLSTGLQLNNLAGLGDALKLDFLLSNKANLKSSRLEYAALINGYGTKFGLQANYLDYQLGGSFKDLRAGGNAYNFGAYLSQPMVRTPAFRLNAKLAFNHQVLNDEQKAVGSSQTRKGNHFSLFASGSWRSIKQGVTYFSFGAQLGKTRSQGNDPALANAGKVKHFALWQYQISHEQSLPKSFAFSLGASGQISYRNLDSAQKMLLGGLYGVRGYKAGVASVDNGHIFQGELKHYLPVFNESFLTTSIFYDYGFGKQYKYPHRLAPSVKNKLHIQSAGVGLSLSAIQNYAINATFAQTVGKKMAGNDKYQLWLSAAKTF